MEGERPETGGDFGEWQGGWQPRGSRHPIARLKHSDLGRRLADDPLVSRAWLRARALPFRATHGHVRRSRRVSSYLRQAERPRLQLGSGPVRLPGWLNSDLVSGDVYLDIGRPLPLPDATFEHVYGEHIIEHVSEEVGRRALREMLRVLRPGGVLRLTTPDLRKIVALYEDRNPVIGLVDYARFLDAITGKQHLRACQVFNDFLRLWGHAWIYDEEDLAAKLREAGFVDVVRREPGESLHEGLRGLERHGPPWENAAEAMCLEATRP